MGTRSTIAIQNEDGTVTGIYCHWDGYTSHNGRILQENYTDEASVRELIALGDLSSLGETVGTKTDFNNAAKGQCVAYGRDRGEKDVDAKTCADWAALLEDFGQEYDYLFTPGAGWTVRYFSGWENAEVTLAEALAKEAEEVEAE
jgi:hypothetical protein